MVDVAVQAMYTYIAMQRTQIYLTEDEARTLDRLAKERGQTRSHLIREAIRETYLSGRISDEEFEAALAAGFGAWKELPGEDRSAYLRDLKGPGLGYKIAKMRGEPPPDPEKDLSR